MNIWRSTVLIIWTLVLTASFAFIMQYRAFETTVLDREKSKQWLAESSTYDILRDEVLAAQVLASVEEKIPENNLIDRAFVREVLADVLPEKDLRKRTEPVIDSTYRWLDSKEPGVEFDVSLADRKEQFYRTLEVKLGKKIANLKDCGDYRYPPEEAILEDLCLPAYVTAGEATQAAMGYIRASDFPLGESVTEDTFTLPAENKAVIKQIPTYLNYLWVLNFVAIAVALFTTLLVLWRYRLLGLIGIGSAFILGGVVSWFATPLIMSIGVTDSTGVMAVVASAAGMLLSQYAMVASRYGLLSIILGAVLIGASAWILRRRAKRRA